MKPITLSINPTFYCNLSCAFCYLTPQQLKDRRRIALEVLEERIDEVLAAGYTVTHVDLYGGEVLLLPEDYLNAIKTMLHARGIDDIVLITNLTLVNSAALDEDFELGVSYDFTAREKSELVFSNLITLPRWFNLLTLASREFLDQVTPDEFVQTVNLLSNANSVEIKPYSENQANQQPVSFKEYEDFVWAVIHHPDRTFYFENESQLIKSLDGKRNAYSDDHLYITPNGRFAVLEFDLNDREYFLELDSIQNYEMWTVKEKARVNKNQFCGNCEFKGRCLSEHLREVKSLDESCNGFHGLLVRWQEHESTSPSEARNNPRFT